MDTYLASGQQLLGLAGVFTAEWAGQLVSTIVYGVLGVALLFGIIKLMDVITPFSFTKEIEADQNTALGIVIAGVVIGVSIILAACIHG